MLIGGKTLRHAIDALRDVNARMAAVIDRSNALEGERLALERERFAWERERALKAEAERAGWLAKEQGDDLPRSVTATITELAGNDAAVRAQLVRFARLRHGRNVEESAIVAELRRGDLAARL